jgi:RNA polymerase sigma-70 factor, ECF subfamily
MCTSFPGRHSVLKVTFDEIVRLHWSPIFHFVLASVRDRQLAEDLTQDCFWNAYKGWECFRGDSSAGTWLRHIALNVIRNFIRSERVQFWRRALPLDSAIQNRLTDTSKSPEAVLVRREAVRTIWEAAGSLSPKQRVALRLRFGEELNVPEIARVMEVSEGAVKAHLFRAVHSIRRKRSVKTLSS